MRKYIFKIIRYTGLPLLSRAIFQQNKVTILTFHEISPEVAHQSFTYLKKYYNIIPLQTFCSAIENKNEKFLPRYSLIITFDDGSISNYNLLPLLRDMQIPITIFLNSGIINTNRHYWFKFNQKSHNNETLKNISNKDRLILLAKQGFRQNEEYTYPQALNKNQIMEMSRYINMQSHTQFHPCLTKCDIDEAESEISNCKNMLEGEYGFKIYSLAFPNGDYSEREIELAKKIGFKLCLTVDKGYNTIYSDPYRLKRLDVNDTDNLDEFIVKTSGIQSIFFRKRLLSILKKD